MNLKFLLVGINAKYIHSNPAIRSLKAYAGKDFANYIDIAEYTINNHREDILDDIYRHNPSAIGISVYIWNVDIVTALIRDLGKVLPDTQIFLGGPEVSFESEKYLSLDNIKGIFIGEGEVSFKELINIYVQKYICDYNASSDISNVSLTDDELKSIPGLLIRSGYTGVQSCVSMDDLPFLYQSEDNGDSLLNDYENRIIYYESSRGCPFRCSYCLSSIDKTTHFRKLELVFKELDFFLSNRVKQVKFIDRTFNCNAKRSVEIWKYLAEHDNGVTNFHFEIAADILSNEEIDVLSKLRPGLVQLEIGVQTTNETTLKAINRPTSIRHLSEIVARIRSNYNVHIHLDLIAGLPYEDLSSFKQSFNDVFRMKPDQLQLGFLKVLNGAPIKKQVDEFDIKYTSDPPYEVLSTQFISYEEIRQLKRVEQMVETFYNSAQFTQSVPYLLTFFNSPFDLFDALGTYYKKNNLFVMTPARSRRYDIVLEFAESLNQSICSDNRYCPVNKTIDIERLRELLTLDFYLREKPKAKPDFVKKIPAEGIINRDMRDPLTGNFVLNI